MRLTRVDVTVADSPEGPTIAFVPEEVHFATGEGVELVLGGTPDATFAASAVSFDDDGVEARFVQTRSDDGRRVVLSAPSPEPPASVATYGYHVAVQVGGETIRSKGYPTVNQHPPIG